MRSLLVAISSFVLTTLSVWATYSKKKQFFPTVVYLTNHQPCIAILLFQCVVLLFMLAKLASRLFFGRLQQAEVDNLVSQSWYAFFDMCLVFTFFQDELGTEFLFLFAILLLVRAFHWLLEERVDYMERTPVLNTLFHMRILSLLFILGAVDVFHIKANYGQPATHGTSVHAALGVEYFILLLNLFSITVRYSMHSIDSMRDHPWDKKTMYLLYMDILIGIFRLAVYVDFIILMWTLHPLPVFIVRPIYLSVRALKKAIQDVLLSRRAIRYMNTVFRDASAEDLAASSDTVCIICREEMQLPGNGVQQNQNTTLKRLPCSHIFHVTCLRSWFQRQQSCPTCRMDIIRQVQEQERQGTRPQGQVAPMAGPNEATGVTPAAGTTIAPQPNVGAFGRPPWMPMGAQYPFMPPFWGHAPPTFPTSQNSTASSSSVPLIPPIPSPMFTPPFVGMPVIYPGNLFPNATSPMPEPPNSVPGAASEAKLRASVEARFTALRQISVLLNAAVLQMNAYLNAATGESQAENPWLTAFGSTMNNSDAVKPETTSDKGDAEKVVENGLEEALTEDASSTKDNPLMDLRKRRLDHFSLDSPEDKPKDE